MKSFLMTLTLLVAGTALAADQPKPWITKSSGGGFMMQEVAGGETCELFSNHVQITHRLGMHTPTSLTLTESRSIRLTGDIATVIAKAAEEKIEERPNMLCDGPSTTVMAGDVLLYSTGGCGSPRKSRSGIYSGKLTQLIEVYCPKTFDFSHE